MCTLLCSNVCTQYAIVYNVHHCICWCTQIIHKCTIIAPYSTIEFQRQYSSCIDVYIIRPKSQKLKYQKSTLSGLKIKGMKLLALVMNVLCLLSILTPYFKQNALYLSDLNNIRKSGSIKTPTPITKWIVTSPIQDETDTVLFSEIQSSSCCFYSESPGKHEKYRFTNFSPS